MESFFMIFHQFSLVYSIVNAQIETIMTDNQIAKSVFHSMYDNDPFSKWLGIEPVNIEQGTCTLRMTVRPEMLNGFSIMHGGISYALADSAFAFASNSYGKKAVSTSVTMQYPKATKAGDTLIATAKTISLSNKTAILDVEVSNQNGDLVGLFRGTAYRTDVNWIEETE
jgi:acyl-CoA thioesterase